MIDEFVLHSGLMEYKGKLDDVASMILSRNAECFLRSGGHLSMREWFDLSEDSKSAFVIAGNRIMRDKAVLVGLASQSTYQASMIMAQDDDGEMLVRNAITAALDSSQIAIENKREVEL